jgi:hypothetical protein
MAEFRNIHTRIWKDNWFSELETDEKLLFIYLFSNERASVCGMYELPMKYIVFETGISADRVSEILNRFSAAGKVYYQNGIVWVVNLKRYNDSGESVKVRIRAAKDLDSIPDCDLKREYYKHENIPYPKTQIPYSENDLETDTEMIRRRDGDAPGYAIPPAPSPSSPPADAALRIYCGITGFVAAPGSADEWQPKIDGLYYQYGRDEQKTIEYCKPFYAAWCGRRTKDGRFYSKTSMGWLDWALAGEVPPEGTHNNGGERRKRNL